MNKFYPKDTITYNLLTNLFITLFKLNISPTTGGYVGDYYENIINLEINWLYSKQLYDNNDIL